MSEVINVKILHLPVKAKWYNMQESGEKPEEYREINPYWIVRLFEMVDDEITGNYVPVDKKTAEHIYSHPDCSELFEDAIVGFDIRPRHSHVLFRYGYTNRCFIHRIDSITIGRGKPEWGAPTDRDVFIIRHHKEPSPFIKGKEL